MNRIFAAAMMAAALVSQAVAAPPAYRESMETAGRAYEAQDWAALNDALDAAQAAHPFSLYVYRNRILARLLAGRKDEALDLAAKAAERGLVLDLSSHPAFGDLAALPGFAAVSARMQANAEPFGVSAGVIEFPESGLLPEAIAFGRNGTLYVGGVRTGAIMKAARKAETLSPVATAPGGVFDLEIRGRKLWAAVNNQIAYEAAGASAPFAAIMIFDAKTGEKLRDVRIGEGDALLGDLEVAQDGTAYASDSLTPRIYRLGPGGAPEILAEDARFVNLQGIALDEKNRRLFAADYLAGLFTIGLETGAVAQIENRANAHLGGIDGLYYHDGALIGIQNGTSPQRIVRIELDGGGAAVSVEVLLQNLDGWNEPTHGAILGKAFHYIATSNWPSYGGDGALREGALLQPLRIMMLPLNTD